MPRFAVGFGFFFLSAVDGDSEVVKMPHDTLGELVDPELSWAKVPNLIHGKRSCGYFSSELEKAGYGDMGNIDVYLKPKLFESNYSDLDQLLDKQFEGVNFLYLSSSAKKVINSLWGELLSQSGFSSEKFPWEGTRHPELIPKLLMKDKRLSNLKAVSYPVQFNLTCGSRDLSVVTVIDATIIDGATASWFEESYVSLAGLWKGHAPKD
ncbi:hypothetical protein ACJJI4_23690 (plasmid) [Microbulbifer sp. TRSA002]|uniref:hypothetical protein n=1 Tax=Microbulbifer sp. TRSA002 TaxID=3243382 RepID=UPI00403A68E8